MTDLGLSAAKLTIFIITITILTTRCSASNGDRTQFFSNCRQNCERQNCSADGLEIQEQAVKYYRQSIFDLFWTCADECQYGCMWRTVDAFFERGWQVPQFYGKWPFVRFMGLQEPASVLFSLMNLLQHWRMLGQFRREIRRDTPCFKLWHVFAFTCMNGWIWSTVFHARDFPLTELLDYAFAYSIVLVSLYCMLMRMLHKYSLLLRGIVSLIFISYYINYFAYLSVGKFSYSFNMTANIVTGVLTAVGWFIWCYAVRKRRPYYRKVLRFFILFGMAMSLELLDFPPILWILDAHALWHLATVPLIGIFYSFVIDDCKMLRQEQMFQYDQFDKEI